MTAKVMVDDIEQLARERDEAIRGIPSYLRHPIYLPTERIAVRDQIAGLKAVKELYASLLDEYHRPALRRIKTARTRKRCFVIGNGPSLLHTDLTKLKDEVTFVMNGFFLKMPELDWTPTFYVCEDHLVAEDRAVEINALRGPTKFFPANLRYVIEPDEQTVFYDHRPRKSYPHGFDFSFDADINTYTGGTVTFSCLQLAAYMGFEEIYLIGVDASYAIPADATLSGGGRIKELDMKSDDPNHFHPDYFGKGKRWHEPNVHTMIDAYKEARRACDARGIAIYNATVGGKLEVFPRVAYDDLFPPPASDLPKILLFDLTRINDGTATGELKGSLLKDWPQDRLLQVFGGSGSTLGTLINGVVGAANLDDPHDFARLKSQLDAFHPDVILYRPVPRTSYLHELAMGFIAESEATLATWIMDDWPSALARQHTAQFATLDADLRSLFRQSAGALSIGDAMSRAFGERYEQQFSVFANGIERADWNWSTVPRTSKDIVIRYSGSLAKDMGLESVLLVARTVELLAAQGMTISLEINTRKFWANEACQKFYGLTRTSISTQEMSGAQYRSWLSEADIVLICYNFDEASRAYVRYSIANKLPECLASGATLLAVGPGDIATMELVRTLQCSAILEEPSPEKLADLLKELAESPDRRAALSARAREVVLNGFDMRVIRQRFIRWLVSTASYGRSNRLLQIVRRAESRLRDLEGRNVMQNGPLNGWAVQNPQTGMQAGDVNGAVNTFGALEALGKKFDVISSSLRSRFSQKAS